MERRDQPSAQEGTDQIRITVNMRRDPRDSVVLLAVFLGMMVLLDDLPGWKALAVQLFMSVVAILLGGETLWKWIVAAPVENDPLAAKTERGEQAHGA